jgi:anaerobic nitric oxide reductase flavorubredoxin
MIMVKVTLKDGVFWVGVVDWNIRDFHGYITSRGSSYNAYLVMDEKTALVDTVKAAFCNELIEHVSEHLNLDKLDYIIVNHVEMDHSSSLPTIAKLAKNAKILSSARGKEELIKHYGSEFERVETVKSGDTLKLGKKTLTFLEAPMLHWPDSMFTYLVEDKILMPNDAFGQHLASSGRFDDTVDQQVLMEEAVTYYANILTPFAPLIVRKIEEVVAMKLPIDIIAPSHGIIWRKDPMKIVNAYMDWCTGKTVKQKAVIVFDTMW